MSDWKIVWDGVPLHHLDETILESLEENGFGRDWPMEDLCFHTWPMTGDWDGPCVVLYGRRDHFLATLVVSPDWTEILLEGPLAELLNPTQ
ncbi:hypothetical protein HKCCE2091_09300 [Rhodobacterales bacterium HKCCE2091]|nr:hypothetical protein [Rhodobacterales bacterium HKCCE2091]